MADDAPIKSPPYPPVDSGEQRMRELGYKQELNRSLNLFTNFAISFSIISILTGITGSFNIGFTNGGPVSVVWGWVVVSVMTMLVGLAMAEIVSALPSSGGPYFWGSQCAGKHGAAAAWFTGFYNLLGQVAVTASIDFILANHLASMISLSCGRVLTNSELLGVLAAILFVHCLLNCSSTRFVGWLSGVSTVWHFVGTVALVILIPAVAPTHQSASYVFTNFDGWQVEGNGITNNGYLFLVGMLMAQFNLTGYDACAHMSEETKGADRSAPIAIILALGSSSIGGLAYILALLFSIQDPATLTTGAANGYISGQIFYDAFYARYGSGTGGIIAMGIPAIAMFGCGLSSLTSNSRMCWSFSRDGALPFGRHLSAVNKWTQTPVNATIFMATVAFLLCLPLLKSVVAFQAVVSISTIGLYISYAIPILMRLTFGRKQFVHGPFYLGPGISEAVSWAAVVWVAFITVVFCLPTLYPVTSTTLNYAPIAVGIVLVFCIVSWLLPRPVGARFWYKGAQPTLDDSDRLPQFDDSAHPAHPPFTTAQAFAPKLT